MVKKTNLEKQFKNPNGRTTDPTNAKIGVLIFLIVLGCILAIFVALTIKFIYWLFHG